MQNMKTLQVVQNKDEESQATIKKTKLPKI